MEHLTSSRRPAPHLAVALCLLLGATAADATGLEVSPMRVKFSADRNIASVTLSNSSRETLSIEAEALPWPEDAPLATARDLTINPPIVNLAPGAKVTVRIGLVKRLPADVERTYRLYFTELPSPRANDAQGIGVRLRMGIPVFVAPDAPKEEPLQWSGSLVDDGLVLVARNRGNVHQRVEQVVLKTADSQFTAAQGLPYVLPGRQAEFRIPPGIVSPGSRVRIDVRSNGVLAPVDVQLP